MGEAPWVMAATLKPSVIASSSAAAPAVARAVATAPATSKAPTPAAAAASAPTPAPATLVTLRSVSATSAAASKTVAPPPAAAAAAPAPAPAPAGPVKYSHQRLKEKPLPDGVDPKALETFLLDEDFAKVFGGISLAEFRALPKWKQDLKKKEASLL